ncbi:serine/threonine-protein kinase [Micromonospora sp. NBC_01412]|uniref:serine/threonine-protein kinase n=1 Tax=Micromonospora sp. NBC_01412 TaxID=2903590 RepID=UPI0032494806
MAGTILRDRYRLGRFPLAHKGMGEVWTAQDTLLDRPVIVKFVDAVMLNVDLVRRFRREALLTARLDHPGVPAIYDLGEHDGRPYAVLQKINGISLTDLVAEQGPLPIGWVAAIGAQISCVLLAARQIGLVHRDIKPSNVMLDTCGAVKVLDFGLADMPDDDRYSRITQTGQTLGTVGYMAPEQILGGPVDHHTDLYGLGATLFDLLTAHPPFDGVTTMTTLRHQLDDPPPRPTHMRPETPAVLDDLVHALLAIRPQDRPATAAEVYAVLAPLAQDLAPIPGVLDDPAGAVRAYAAIVGRVPQRSHLLVTVPPEHDRALRQLNALLQDRVRTDGPEHAAVLDLQREIEQLSKERPAPRQSVRYEPNSDR